MEASASIKNKINNSSILSAAEKQEWLFLLPKMNETQIAELQRILSVQVPKSEESRISNIEPRPPIPSPGLQPPSPKGEEGYSPVPTPSSHPLLAGEGQGVRIHTSVIHHDTGPFRDSYETAPKIVDLARDNKAAIPVTSMSLSEIKGLSFVQMRQAQSVYEFFDDLGAKIAVIARSGQATAGDIIEAFEASPLYASYIKVGSEMLEGKQPILLSRSEFEALADFRTSLKKILQIT